MVATKRHSGFCTTARCVAELQRARDYDELGTSKGFVTIYTVRCMGSRQSSMASSHRVRWPESVRKASAWLRDERMATPMSQGDQCL